MKRKICFLLAVFVATVLLMAVQKPVFLLYYAGSLAGCSFGEVMQVLWHGLSLDLTVAGYVTALPALLILLSLWVRLPFRTWSRVLNVYFAVVACFAALIFAVDIALYEHWGFRIDSTVLIYLADPKEAMSSVDFWLGVRQTLFFAVTATCMLWLYRRCVRCFDGERLPWRAAAVWTPLVLLLCGLDFLAIRGGVGASTANVSKVCFSPKVFLNHAAVNPVFSFLSSLGKSEDFAAQYPFYDDAELDRRFEALRGNTQERTGGEKVLNTARPNVVLVILESFARTVMDEKVDGEPVMPHLQRLKEEGIYFENFFANSFRTDRGEVAVLSGFPAQTRHSIMKMPVKSASLPSVARSLAREGYATSFTYGGDLNFTNQSSYMYATGWQELTWQKDLSFEGHLSKWGYDDAAMCDYFADRVIARSRNPQPFLAGFLTLSSHIPFDVPYSKFEDRELNAFAFSDECVGRMIEKLKASEAWENLLVILVADHGFPYPKNLLYNEPLRHRIPMIWTGGAVQSPRKVAEFASQIDIAATLLGQLDIAHDDFEYSKDIFSPATPKFGYYAFNDGFGVVTAGGSAVWDATTGRSVGESDPQLMELGRTMLQYTYRDISRR